MKEKRPSKKELNKKLISSMAALIAEYPPKGFNRDAFILLLISGRTQDAIGIINYHFEIQTLEEG